MKRKLLFCKLDLIANFTAIQNFMIEIYHDVVFKQFYVCFN